MFIINSSGDWDPRDQHISETMRCPPSWSPSHLASLKYSCVHPQVFSLPSNPLSNSRISALKMLRRKDNEVHEEFWDFDSILAKDQFCSRVWKPESPHGSVTNMLSLAEWVFTCWAAIGGEMAGNTTIYGLDNSLIPSRKGEYSYRERSDLRACLLNRLFLFKACPAVQVLLHSKDSLRDGRRDLVFGPFPSQHCSLLCRLHWTVFDSFPSPRSIG